MALLFAMAASINHLAWTFGTVERPGQEWLGWIPAIAVDAGLAAMAYSIQQRRRTKRPVAVLWSGVAGFALISALANFYHALAVEGIEIPAGMLAFAKPIILSATLPAMYIFLGEIISADDATAAERAAKAAERESRKAELEAAREAERASLEAKQASLEAAQAEEKQFTCPLCGDGKMYTRNGLNAHMRAHRDHVPFSETQSDNGRKEAVELLKK